MKGQYKRILACAIAFTVAHWRRGGRAARGPLYIATGDTARPPIGWVEFCADHAAECKSPPTAARDVVLSSKAWTDLVRINKLGQRDHQADDRHGALGRGREVVATPMTGTATVRTTCCSNGAC